MSEKDLGAVMDGFVPKKANKKKKGKGKGKKKPAGGAAGAAPGQNFRG